MNRVEKLRRQAVAIALGVCVAAPMALHSDRAHAGSGGAFVGGLVGGHILTRAMDNDQRRTQAAEAQAYQQQPQVVYQQAPPASSGGGSTQQRLDELDALAAKGYITQSEYKTRRQGILDSM
jgi:hypothetical protein